jgi:hypothetical protein
MFTATDVYWGFVWVRISRHNTAMLLKHYALWLIKGRIKRRINPQLGVWRPTGWLKKRVTVLVINKTAHLGEVPVKNKAANVYCTEYTWFLKPLRHIRRMRQEHNATLQTFIWHCHGNRKFSPLPQWKHKTSLLINLQQNMENTFDWYGFRHHMTTDRWQQDLIRWKTRRTERTFTAFFANANG